MVTATQKGPALALRKLVKSYGKRRAVDELSLDLHPGEILGLLGPNGAGKSTTIAMASGLMAPDAGEVDVLGAGSPRESKLRSRIGIAPQALALYDELSGRENLEFFARLQGLGGRELASKVDEALDFVGLTPRAKERVAVYSGGMKRRMNLAAAILHDPELIILDEPSVGVDPQSRSAIFDNILALKERGATILYTTHAMDDAHRLCDRVAIMDEGKILALDTVAELVRAHGGESRVSIRVDGEEIVTMSTRPLEELQRHDPAKVEDFRVDTPNLETVFLALTGKELRDS